MFTATLALALLLKNVTVCDDCKSLPDAVLGKCNPNKMNENLFLKKKNKMIVREYRNAAHINTVTVEPLLQIQQHRALTHLPDNRRQTNLDFR